MSTWLSDREQRLVAGAEIASTATPIPTQIVSNGEYLPPPQSETQKRVEQRILELSDVNGKRLGLSRRQFMQTGCGMAAAFLAMNEIYGSPVFQVDAAEAREPELIQARAQSLAGQFVFDVQTHFVRDDFDHKELLGLAKFAQDTGIRTLRMSPRSSGTSSRTTSRKSTTTATRTSRCFPARRSTIQAGGSCRTSKSPRRARSSMISRAHGACLRTR